MYLDIDIIITDVFASLVFFASPSTARSLRLGQLFRNLKCPKHIHTCYDTAGDGDDGNAGLSGCLVVCASAQAERPLAPGGVLGPVVLVPRSCFGSSGPPLEHVSVGRWVRPTAVNRENPGLAGAIPLFLGAETKSEVLKSTLEASASQGREAWLTATAWLVWLIFGEKLTSWPGDQV